MNAGASYKTAKRQAQANANFTGHDWQMVFYNGVWWIERLGMTSVPGEMQKPIDGAEVIKPEPKSDSH